MKKIEKILILIITTFILTPTVFAANHIFTNKETVTVGEEFVITVTFNSIKTWDIVASSSSTNTDEDCTIDKENSNGEDITEVLTESKTCTATDPGTITVSLTGEITNGNDEKIDVDESIEITVTEASPEPTSKGLKNLQVTNGTLSPLFSTNESSYTITLSSSDTETFKITATANDENDTISAKDGHTNESINLNSNITYTTSGGNNNMLIYIYVGDYLYTLIIGKPQSSTIAAPELTTLTIGNQSIPLVSGLHDYTITLDDVSNYQINATINDPINYQFNSFLTIPSELHGENVIPITIEPKNSTSSLSSVTYTVTVKSSIIEPTPSSNPGNNSQNNNTNPQTSTTTAFVVGLILIISLCVSLHLYKQNINGYN